MALLDSESVTRVPPGAADHPATAREPCPDTSDEALMARIAVGDETAFRIFAPRHVPRFLAIAQRIVGDPSDAEEVAQDALLRVWRNAPHFHAGPALVTTWLYRIVVNLALDRARKNRGRFVALADIDERADPAPDAEMVEEGRQLERFVARAIAELPTRQRVALTLCYFEALDCAEAAAIMQISVSAMESLLVRGRRTLRDRINGLGASERARYARREKLWPEAAHRSAPILSFPLDAGVGALALAR